MGQALMIQGTSSSVGKSSLVAALCRIFQQEGYKVAPFKSQNMGRETVLTPEGLSLGTVQYQQALSARVQPQAEMNPIFLKPLNDLDAEVFVLGHSLGVMSAQEYIAYKPKLIQVVESALKSLRESSDLVLIEGAGSPAEVNLREHDLVNMTVAKLAAAPVLLVADIDLGGVFAYVHGTLKLLLPEERQLVKGIIINKFRGDPSYFSSGSQMLAELVDLPVVGIIPFFEANPEVDVDKWAAHVQRHLDLPLIRQISGLEGRL